MSKSVFVSSTIHDLQHLREGIQAFLERHGCRVLMSEKGTIPVDSTKHSYTACLDAAKECEVLIGVIGRRFGGAIPDSTKSITQSEIEMALDHGKGRVLVFVDKSVWDAREILKPYLAIDDFRPSKIVDDKRVFDVIEAIHRRKKGNWIFTYRDYNEICQILRRQLEFPEETRKPDARDLAIEEHDRLLASEVLSSVHPFTLHTLSDGYEMGRIGFNELSKVDVATIEYSTPYKEFLDPQTQELFGRFLETALEAISYSSSHYNPHPYDPHYHIVNRSYSYKPDEEDFEEKIVLRSRAMKDAFEDLFQRIRHRFPEIVKAIMFPDT